jgi:nucleotidyltransferase substrate binding protein (TIGR01987 family)
LERWKQRFENYQKAINQLEVACRIYKPSQVEIAGIIQIFQYTFELGWKTIKDFLFVNGIDLKYPKEIIKEAFQNEIIDDGETWLEMLDSRNKMSHTYDEETANQIYFDIVNKYHSELLKLQTFLKK